MFYKNECCAEFPSVFDLEFINIYWQNLHTFNGIFQLFGAYYDVQQASEICPSVRILGMINRIEPTIKVRVIYTSKGMSKKYGVRFIH
jgi:hypothetical protein